MSDPYDPLDSDTAKSPGGQYVSRKDIRVISVVLVILAIVAWPVYMYMLRQVYSSTCNKNLRKIANALTNYISDSDDRLPFSYERAGYETNEINLRNGYAYTWQWQLQRYTGKDWGVYLCPGAKPGESTLTSDGTSVHASSYGMLGGYDGMMESMIPYPDQKILIGETAKGGTNGTYDPLPLTVEGSALKEDGFQIGFDNNSLYPDSKTNFATRLAFPHSNKPQLDQDSESRHPEGIHLLTVGGALISRDGSIGQVVMYGGSFGPWDVPHRAPTPSVAPTSSLTPPKP